MFRNILLLFALFLINGGCHNFDSLGLYRISPPVDHAECPTWDGRKNVLYYVDIHSGKIFNYDYATKEINSIRLNGQVAPVIPSKSDPSLLIVGLNRSIAAVKWNRKSDLESLTILTTLAEDKPKSRLNEGKADKEGRIWFGTMGFESPDGKSLSPNDGTLFKITTETLTNPSPMITPVNVSNGLAWNKDNNKFYYIDSPSRQIAEYDYDNSEGAISNRRVVFDFKNHKLAGVPDGMTIDKDDNLWIALYKGGSIIKIDPKTGKLLERIPVPADCVTSVAWGGPKLDVLFVTTSRLSLNEQERDKQPGAGSVYALTNLGTSGFAPFEADITG